MNVELYGLRIFCQVMQDNTFSKAAKSLKITQPTVSQQIAKLEHNLQGKLFERVGHDLIPTLLANELYGLATNVISTIDEFGDKLQNQQSDPKGLVRYAMPESCQWTLHYKKIMSQIIETPDITFKIDILTNEQIVQSLIEGKIDFGFVVGERLAPELRFQKFSDEAYAVVSRKKEFFKPFSKGGNLKELRLITYPGWELFFELWAKAHGLWKELKPQLIEPAVHIGSLAGALHAIQEGAGVGIVPTQCVAKDLSEKNLFEWKPEKHVTVTNPVYIAKKVGNILPKRAEVIMSITSGSMKK